MENTEWVRQAWEEVFDTLPPSYQAIYKIRDKFDDTGSVVNAKNLDVLVFSQQKLINEIRVALTFVKSEKVYATYILRSLLAPLNM